jgi:hypothetical protein
MELPGFKRKKKYFWIFRFLRLNKDIVVQNKLSRTPKPDIFYDNNAKTTHNFMSLTVKTQNIELRVYFYIISRGTVQVLLCGN